jgi:signal transduction histidine kinase
MNSITRHDILNQLTSVFGYLGFSLASCTDPVMREYLKKALSAAETIQSQILFTRDYQDIGSAAPQWQNMEQVFTKTAGTLNLDGIAVETSLKDLWVCADPLIEKVFFNLLENSLRHGGKISKVRVFSRETDDGLVIIYEDNGVGVPSGAKEKIFRREYFQNTGLGLYLSREILAITNMVITETGTEGNGVRFEISVPKGMYGKRIEENSPCIATRGRGIPQ